MFSDDTALSENIQWSENGKRARCEPFTVYNWNNSKNQRTALEQREIDAQNPLKIISNRIALLVKENSTNKPRQLYYDLITVYFVLFITK